jgi:hypothetical protein
MTLNGHSVVISPFCLAQRSSRFQCAASHSNRERQLRKSHSVAEWTAHEREISVMNILENEEVRPLDDNELAAATGGYRLANETAIKFAATIRKGGDPEDGGE